MRCRYAEPVLARYPAEITAAIDPIGTPIEVLGRILQGLIPVYRTHFGNPLAG